MLEIKNLHVKIADEEREILKGLSLDRPEGRGARDHGPQRLGQVDARLRARRPRGLRGHRAATSCWNGESLLEMEPDERAAKGVFLAFQYPMEIPGVAGLTFLRTARSTRVRKARGQAELTTPEFLKFVREKAERARASTWTC